jgi:hypothetical protein
MCKRHVKDIREYEGQSDLCKRQVQEIREHEGDIGHMQETMCRRTWNMKERQGKKCARDTCRR